jgi:hypothetical protein
MLLRLVVAIALVAGAGTAALADLGRGAVYHVEGEADTGGADPRVAALDVAFAAATREALADLVAAADLKANKATLDREVIGRARRWVASYKVTADATKGDTRALEVDVHIDVDKLSNRLGELGVAMIAAAQPDPSGTGTGGDPVPGAGGKGATVLLRVDGARGTTASYGAAAMRDVPGLAALSAAVRAAGWQLVPAPASGPAPAPGDELLGDDAARALAAAVGADVAVIVGVEAPAVGQVRGTSERGALARARVRIVDARGVIGDGTSVGGAHGTGEDLVPQAIAAAVVDAFADAQPAGTAAVAAGPVADVTAGPGEVLIEIGARDARDAVAWFAVRAIRDKLAAGKNAHVVIRRLSAREVVLGVTGERAADKLARDIRDLANKISDTSFQTKVNGNTVQVRVSGSP